MNDETAYKYMFLDRMRSDCAYYLTNGFRNKKHLWWGDEKKQIKAMKELYNSLEIKPDWLRWEDILRLEKEMITK